MSTRAAGWLALFLSGVFALLVSGCSYGLQSPVFNRSLVVTGTSIAVLGQEFADVSAAYTKACDGKRLTVKSCSEYRDFGVRFKSSYPEAVSLWHIARSANDNVKRQSAEDVILKLSTDLSVFAVTVLGTTGGK